MGRKNLIIIIIVNYYKIILQFYNAGDVGLSFEIYC